ncbi:group III truncated hemoglobin [Sphingomonas oryzagri]
MMVIDETVLPDLLVAFYDRVRRDALLGPVFDGAVQDWDHHLRRIADFWSSVMLASGRYKGSPVALHLAHASRITPGMFDRWLALWRQTTDEMLAPTAAQALQEKAARIAESLQLALKFPSRLQCAAIGRQPRAG